MRNAITNGIIFDGEQRQEGLSLILEDDRILALVSATHPMLDGLPQFDLKGRMLVPGFIDIQVNGGGDVLFNDAPCLETLKTMARAHRQFGTTGFLPTLITTDIKTMQGAIAAVDAAMAEKVPGVLGIHLEGPFLSNLYAGVHRAERFIHLDDETIELVSALKSGVTLLTLAPECTSLANITRLRAAGIIVFAGHSGATYEQTKSAIKAGISGFTHLFNAMSPLTSRTPGMVGAALEDKQSWAGIIADGIHVHPASFSIAVAAKTRGKILLVTDAMPTVGGKQAAFKLDGELIKVTDGRCENQAGSLAGSDLNMLEAVTNAMAFADLKREEAVSMASTYPAAAIGLQDELGCIKPGARASFVALDQQHRVVATWVDGKRDE